ncbi:MAG: cytochrome c oxidase subunit II [Chloroherpetonaceae bacterium]|nr:cytochrome c oxidase subunit II [Chloroherpetonaceae bacterium]MDW8437776.1 cytochrome c oxidase subunit II [Chloroherpetonaceae bacterium]
MTLASRNLRSEIVWTLAPIALAVVVIVWGVSAYRDSQRVEADAIEIKAIGKKWQWTFLYPNGAKSVNELVAPEGKPLKLVISSEDVAHGFSIPEFRVKAEAIPNQEVVVGAKPTRQGTFEIVGADYCVRSEMFGKARVVSDAEFERWLEERKTAEGERR